MGLYVPSAPSPFGNTAIDPGARALGVTYIGPQTMTPGVAGNFTPYSTITIEVDNLTGGGVVTFAGGSTAAIAQSGIYPMDVFVNAETGTQVSSITASGIYKLLFAGNLWLCPFLSAGTATITVTGS